EQDRGGVERHHHGEAGDTRPVQALVLVVVPVGGRCVLRHAENSILAGPGAPRKMMSGSALGFCAGISKLIPIMPRGSTAASTFFSRSTVSARQQLACFCRVIQAL